MNSRELFKELYRIGRIEQSEVVGVDFNHIDAHQKLLIQSLELLQSWAVNDYLDQKYLQTLIEMQEKYQKQGSPLAVSYAEDVKAARKSREFTRKQIAKVKAEIMELCHE